MWNWISVRQERQRVLSFSISQVSENAGQALGGSSDTAVKGLRARQEFKSKAWAAALVKDLRVPEYVSGGVNMDGQGLSSHQGRRGESRFMARFGDPW